MSQHVCVCGCVCACMFVHVYVYNGACCSQRWLDYQICNINIFCSDTDLLNYGSESDVDSSDSSVSSEDSFKSLDSDSGGIDIDGEDLGLYVLDNHSADTYKESETVNELLSQLSLDSSAKGFYLTSGEAADVSFLDAYKQESNKLLFEQEISDSLCRKLGTDSDLSEVDKACKSPTSDEEEDEEDSVLCSKNDDKAELELMQQMGLPVSLGSQKKVSFRIKEIQMV